MHVGYSWSHLRVLFTVFFSLFLVRVDFFPALTLELSSRSIKLVMMCLILDGLADLLFDLIEVDCICLRANVKTFLAAVFFKNLVAAN